MEKTITKRKSKKKKSFLTKIKAKIKNVFSTKKKRKSKRKEKISSNSDLFIDLASMAARRFLSLDSFKTDVSNYTSNDNNQGVKNMKKELIKTKLCELVDLLFESEEPKATSKKAEVKPAQIETLEEETEAEEIEQEVETKEEKKVAEVSQLTEEDKKLVFTKDKRAAGKKEIEVFQKQWKHLSVEGQENFLAGKVDSLGNKIKKAKPNAAATAPVETSNVPVLTKKKKKKAILKVCEAQGDAAGIAILNGFKASKISELKEADYPFVMDRAAKALAASSTTSMLD